MFNDFLMFVAPGIVIIASVIIAIWFAGTDDGIGDNDS